ncbi:MAG: GNAT family N-acetyltransferase [Pseudomonadota bacterium]
MDFDLRLLAELPVGIEALEEASVLEGHCMVARLAARYRSGENTFSSPGEALFGAFRSTDLVGIGGLNVDPYFSDATIGRVRHLYVLPQARKLGVGRALVLCIEDEAQKHFTRVQLQSPTNAASAFYQGLGYTAVVGVQKVSHEKRFGLS